MIQDIAPQVMHNQFKDKSPAAAKGTDTVFAFEDRSIYCRLKEDGEHLQRSDMAGISFPTAEELLTAGAGAEDFIYLFAIDEEAFWLYRGCLSMGRVETAEGSEHGQQPTQESSSCKTAAAILEALQERYGYQPETTRVLRRANPKVSCYAGETAYHLYVWYRDNQFCGRCGKRTEYSHIERAKRCPACGNIIYPKIAPAVIVGIMNEAKDKIVMTRYNGRAYKGNALVAGFCEIGETAEETVKREVLEEVGLHVRNIHYYKSQPWGFDSNLLLGYYCTADETEPIHMDDGELARAEWVPRNEIGEENRDLSLTAEMIMHFRDGM